MKGSERVEGVSLSGFRLCRGCPWLSCGPSGLRKADSALGVWGAVWVAQSFGENPW